MLCRVMVIGWMLLSVACSESEVKESVNPTLPGTKSVPVSEKIVPIAPFKAPNSLQISIEKAKQFAQVSAGLFLLAQQWSDRIQKANESERLQILNSYEQAREQMAAKMGLAGLDEFYWIQSKALSFPGNKLIFEQVGVKVPQ